MTMSKLLTENIAPCRSLFTFLFFLLTFSAISLTVSAQSTATLSGVVQDQNADVIAGAAITIQNKATSFERTATTNENGQFTVSFLPPGTYSVLVRRDGFTAVEVPDVTLNVADQKSMTVQLKVGDASATVEVQPDAFMVNTGTSVSTTIDKTFVSNLPLNGRSFSSLILLTPGVTIVSGAGNFSVNGQRPSTNSIMVDGVSANVAAGGGQALTGAYAPDAISLVSQEALEEFKVQTSSYTADTGRMPGGQVQVVTKSGTNEWHWSAFNYFRNEAFDARNFFNFKPQPQAALRQNQFGGTIGGPLPFFNFGDGGGPVFRSGKDRTFFFFSYEGQRLQLPTAGILQVPSLRVRSQAAAALTPLLNAYPTPTGPESMTNTNCPVLTPPSPPDPACNAATGKMFSGIAPFNYAISNPTNADMTSIRIDRHIGSRLRLFGRFNEASADAVSGVLSRASGISSTRTLTIGATSVLSPRATNDLRFNYSLTRGASESYLASLGGSTPVDVRVLAGGTADWASLSMPNGGGGITSGVSADSYQRQLQFTDTFSITKGSHQISLGGDVRFLSPTFGAKSTLTGSFSTEAASRTGTVGGLIIRNLLPSRPRFVNISTYVMDTWKATKRLTLDLGLRWDVNPPPTEADGQMPQIVTGIRGTNISNLDLSNATLSPPGTRFYKTYLGAFAPRVGAAYLLRQGAGYETVVRGGFGWFYDLGSASATTFWPFQRSRTASPGIDGCISTVFPFAPECVALPSIVPLTLPTTISTRGQDENLKLPYTMQWNLTLEQSLGKGQNVSVGYVAAAGRRLLTTSTVNVSSNSLASGTRPNPNFREIGYTFNGPSSDYHSMQVQYRARFRDRLQALVNYTWSHAIDEASTDLQFSATVLERGNASFDVRHNLSGALSYSPPGWGGNSFLKHLTQGWSVNAIFHAQSGLPLNVTVSAGTIVDGIAYMTRPNLVPGVPMYLDDPSVAGGRRFNVNAFTLPPVITGSIRQQGNLGRNVLNELPLYQVDIGLGRKFSLSEKLGLQLKAEVFNALNHPMFGGYGVNLSIPATFGVPNTTLNRSLGGLNQLYQLGGPRSIQLSAKLSL